MGLHSQMWSFSLLTKKLTKINSFKLAKLFLTL